MKRGAMQSTCEPTTGPGPSYKCHVQIWNIKIRLGGGIMWVFLHVKMPLIAIDHRIALLQPPSRVRRYRHIK